MNFVADVLAAAPPQRLALVERRRDGGRREWRLGELLDRSARLAGTMTRLGVRRGSVVLTLVGNRVEWVECMLACFGVGAVSLSCTEQLRSRDLAHRMRSTAPAAVVADERNRAVVEAAAPDCPVLLVPDPAVYRAAPAPYVDLAADDPALVTFTSGTTGAARPAVHAQRYLTGQRLQARHWLGADADLLVWCTAGTGWSKSARNAVLAPWLRGAVALVHDARFDPEERAALLAEEGVQVLCMAPTEYRVMAARNRLPARGRLRSLVAAGEALDVATLTRWRAATGLDVRDGYGQTETGQLTANPVGVPARPGSMGLPLPGVRLRTDEGELVVDPDSVPTFFLGYLGEPPPTGEWRTGDRVHADEDGYLYFDGRLDDVIVSAGYRIGPAEVEAVLTEHPAVAEAAAVAAPDTERGAVVRAVVVLRDGYRPSEDLARELQEHVKNLTAPYKYPRMVDFVTALPKTATGKVRRAALREAHAPTDG